MSFVLLLAVASIAATLHMLAPDHWLPISTLYSTGRVKRGRPYTMAAAVGSGHGATSSVLGLAVATFGLRVAPLKYLDAAAEAFLVIVAMYIIAASMIESRRAGGVEGASMLVGIIPDPVVVPIFLAAAPLGAYKLAYLTALFTVLSATSLVVVVSLATAGFARALSKVKPQYIDFLVAAILIATAFIIYLTG